MLRPFALSSLVAASLLVSACKSKSPEAAPAPAPAPAPTPTARPAEPPAVADDTLSLAQPEGGKCKWVRLDAASGARRDVLTFEGGCEHAQFAWSPDGRQGAVLQPFGDARPPRAWMVDFLSGQGTALPLPDVGRATELGFDAEGRPVALVAHPAERVEEKGQAFFLFEGKKYPVALQEGDFGLAHAYRREGTAWKRVETQVSSFGTDDASGTAVLGLAKKLGPTTKLDPAAGPRSERVSPEEQEALDAIVPPGDLVGAHGEDIEPTQVWVRVSLPGGPLYLKEEPGEVVSQSVPLRWRVGGKLVEPEKLALPADASIELATRGPMLLVTSDKAVRLYDAKQHKLLLSLDGAYLPRFWPRPLAASGSGGASRLKLDDPRTALDFLEQSPVNLRDASESCAQQAEAGTLGALVKKARAEAAEWSVRCEPAPGAKSTWACQAQFSQRAADEDSDGPAMLLRYTVDEASRTIPPASLVCQMAG